MSRFVRRLQQSTGHAPQEMASEGLFFALPDMSASTKKVFAHYFGPYPRSINNAATITSDSYTTAFNNPSYSTYAAYGGMFRDRPQWRNQLSGDYKYQDCVWDIQQAKSVGIDGFFVDLLGLSGSNYDNYETLRTAAIDEGNFYIIPMVDANGATAAADAQTAAAYVKRFCIGTGGSGTTPLSSAFFLPNSKYLFSAFKGEGKTLTYWSDLIGYLASDWGIDAGYMPCYVNYNSSSTYTSIQFGSGPWGYGADPSVINAASDMAATARSRGEVFMAPVVAQDQRPGTGDLFDEALNTQALRASWTKAITQDTEYVQMVTWSDYSETAMAPSAANGWVSLDLSAWYISRWKTGSYPTILRDAIYLSHRSRTFGATITGSQTSFLSQWPRGSMSALANNIEVLTFLTASATINVTIGGNNYSYTAPAGMNVQTYPVPGAVAAGSISVFAVRSTVTVASVTSPVEIKSSAINDDYQYFRFSSIRGTSGQFDPITLY